MVGSRCRPEPAAKARMALVARVASVDGTFAHLILRRRAAVRQPGPGSPGALAPLPPMRRVDAGPLRIRISPASQRARRMPRGAAAPSAERAMALFSAADPGPSRDRRCLRRLAARPVGRAAGGVEPYPGVLEALAALRAAASRSPCCPTRRAARGTPRAGSSQIGVPRNAYAAGHLRRCRACGAGRARQSAHAALGPANLLIGPGGIPG